MREGADEGGGEGGGEGEGEGEGESEGESEGEGEGAAQSCSPRTLVISRTRTVIVASAASRASIDDRLTVGNPMRAGMTRAPSMRWFAWSPTSS